MLGSARRASGGFPSRRQLNFHFCSRPKKGSKMRAKMEPFGLQNLNYTRFGAPFGRNWGPKTEKKKGHEKCSKKVMLETQGCACILRLGGGGPLQRSRDPTFGERKTLWTLLLCLEGTVADILFVLFL